MAATGGVTVPAGERPSRCSPSRTYIWSAATPVRSTGGSDMAARHHHHHL